MKTTTGSMDNPFYFSATEMRFSREHKEHYYLYRVYTLKQSGQQADVTLLHGSLEGLSAEPICYQAKVKL